MASHNRRQLFGGARGPDRATGKRRLEGCASYREVEVGV